MWHKTVGATSLAVVQLKQPLHGIAPSEDQPDLRGLGRLALSRYRQTEMYLGKEGDQPVVEVLATEVCIASGGLDLQQSLVLASEIGWYNFAFKTLRGFDPDAEI